MKLVLLTLTLTVTTLRFLCLCVCVCVCVCNTRGERGFIHDPESSTVTLHDHDTHRRHVCIQDNRLDSPCGSYLVGGVAVVDNFALRDHCVGL